MKLYVLKDKLAVPCEDFIEFAEWFETTDRRVRETIIEGVRVSTVFLGMNHNFTGEGYPLLFETMVFEEDDYSGSLTFDVALKEGESGSVLGWCIRTSSWGEAEDAHQRVVEKVTESLKRALRALSDALAELRIMERV